MYITRTRSRYLYGKIKDSLPSRFLSEIGMERKSERKIEHKKFFDNYDSDSDYDDFPRSKDKKVEYRRVDNRPRKQNVDVGAFYVGQIVRHKKFGKGTILSLSGSGISLSAVIEFEGYGRMNIAIAYAPISAEA